MSTSSAILATSPSRVSSLCGVLTKMAYWSEALSTTGFAPAWRVLPRVLALDVDASRLVPVMLDDADADPHVREQAHDAGDKRRLAGIGPSGHRYDWYSTHGRSLHIVRKALC